MSKRDADVSSASLRVETEDNVKRRADGTYGHARAGRPTEAQQKLLRRLQEATGESPNTGRRSSAPDLFNYRVAGTDIERGTDESDTEEVRTEGVMDGKKVDFEAGGASAGNSNQDLLDAMIKMISISNEQLLGTLSTRIAAVQENVTSLKEQQDKFEREAYDRVASATGEGACKAASRREAERREGLRDKPQESDETVGTDAAGRRTQVEQVIAPNIRELPTLHLRAGAQEFMKWKLAWGNHVRYLSRVYGTSKPERLHYDLFGSFDYDTATWVESQPTLREELNPYVIVEAIEAHLYGEITAGYMIRERTQKRQEQFETVSDLHFANEQAVTHALKDLKREEIQDLLMKQFMIVQVRNRKLKELLISHEREKYSQLYQRAQDWERTNLRATKLEEARPVTNTTSTYQASRGRGQNRGRSSDRQGAQRDANSSRSHSRHGRASIKGSCQQCGKAAHQVREDCPAHDRRCNRCGRIGHFHAVCRTKDVRGRNPSPFDKFKNHGRRWTARQEVQSQDGERDSCEEESHYEDADEVGFVQVNAVRDLDCIVVSLEARGKRERVRCLPDTGANVCILPENVALRLGHATTRARKTERGPKLANGQFLSLGGKLITSLTHGQRKIEEVEWQVIPEVDRCIISLEICKQLRLIPNGFPFELVVNQADVSLTGAKEEDKVHTALSLGHGPEIDLLASKYGRIFCGRIRGLAGEPASIRLIQDANPCKIRRYRDIPEAYKGPLKKEIELQIAQGLIEKVEDNDDAEWLHPIVVVPKKGTTDVRLCVDFRRLNKLCVRPHNPQLSPWEIVRKLPKGIKFFAVFDALKGYHQVLLDEASRKKTTFWTPFGKYRYLSLPMGYAGSQDIFTERFGRAVDAAIDGNRVTEDCLVYGHTKAQFLERMERFFRACDKADITLNTKKIQVGPSVVFAGFRLDSNGYQLDPALTEALRTFPVPTSITDVRSFFGLANQLTNFSAEISECTAPLKCLLKKDSVFVWTDEHQHAFEKARDKLAEPKYLTYFDFRRPTRLITDASRLNGLGFVLQQEVEDVWKTVQAGSRFLSTAESRYSMVELELLAIVWACKKCANFVEGTRFTVITDHKSLIPILQDYSLADIENKRLQRFKMKIEHLEFDVVWISGKDNVIADALSRAPSRQAMEDDIIEEANNLWVSSLNTADEMEDTTIPEMIEEFDDDLKLARHSHDLIIEELIQVAHKDEEYVKLRDVLLAGDTNNLGDDLKAYRKHLEDLSVEENGLIVKNGRQILIPRAERCRWLGYLRNVHASPEKQIARSRRSIWWPGINAELKIRRRTMCKSCNERSPSNAKDPIISQEPALYPFQRLHLDYGNYAGKNWLIAADQFSGWPFAKRIGGETRELIKLLTDLCGHYGVPETIISDGGPQFSSKEFKEFCADFSIKHRPSSPHHPQSNGLAEGTVKQMKKLIHCCFDCKIGDVDKHKWLRTLLMFRNTPRRPSGLSPAEILFGRVLRDGMPTKLESYLPQHRAAVLRRQQAVENYKQRLTSVKKDKVLENGLRVLIQDPVSRRWIKSGIIIDNPRRREYIVETTGGTRYRRNQRFLKPIWTGRSPSSTTPGTAQDNRDETTKQITDTKRSTRQRKATQRFEADRDTMEAQRKAKERRGRKKRIEFGNTYIKYYDNKVPVCTLQKSKNNE